VFGRALQCVGGRKPACSAPFDPAVEVGTQEKREGGRRCGGGGTGGLAIKKLIEGARISPMLTSNGTVGGQTWKERDTDLKMKLLRIDTGRIKRVGDGTMGREPKGGNIGGSLYQK